MIYLIIDEFRKIESSESSFLGKIYMYTLYNNYENRDLKIVTILRKTISFKCSAVKWLYDKFHESKVIFQYKLLWS